MIRMFAIIDFGPFVAGTEEVRQAVVVGEAVV